MPAEGAGRHLAAELLRAGHAVRTRVTGTSMAPTLRPGDLVELEPLRAPARRGEVVYAQLPCGALVLHRVLRRWRDGSVQTRGDAHRLLDARVARAQVLGRVRGAPRRWRRRQRLAGVRAWCALASTWLSCRAAAALRVARVVTRGRRAGPGARVAPVDLAGPPPAAAAAAAGTRRP